LFVGASWNAADDLCASSFLNVNVGKASTRSMRRRGARER
jgi:hypothetical protein